MNDAQQPGDVLAIDVGGTRLRAAVVSPDGVVRVRLDRPTASAARSSAVSDLAATLLKEYRCARGVAGVPGRVDYEQDRLEYAPNLPSSWAGELTGLRLSDTLGLPVSLANDADIAAVGETFFGAGRGAEDVVYVTVSTGVGAGVLLGRRLVRGRRSGIEIGHTVIDQVALAAGQPATVEDLGSGTALARAAAAAGLAGDGAALADLVRTGDRTAALVWAHTVHAAAIGVANLAFLFSPQVIVLGGGVSSTGALLRDPVGDYLDTCGPPGLAASVDVRIATLGDDAGLIGAAGWSDATRGS